MSNKKIYIVGALLVVIAVLYITISSHQKTATSKVHKTTSTKSTTATSNNTASTNISTDPQDIVPGTYKNQINNISTRPGLMIVSGRVENNVDAGGKIISDHLELTLKNISTTDMHDLEMYYTVKDLTTNKSEGYYKKLTGFVLKTGETTSIHFDNKTESGHFGANKNSIYFASVNKLQFDVEVSAPQFQIAKIQIFKDAGGAEVKD